MPCCLTVSVSVLPECDSYRWERVSQLAWSAYWARRCIWSPRGCPWKKKGTKHSEYTWRWVKHRVRKTNLRGPPKQDLEREKHSQNGSLFTITAAHAASKMLVTEEEKQLWWKARKGSPLQLQYVNNSVQSERSFWCCTADCTGIQLFINPFFALPCCSFMLCYVSLLCEKTWPYDNKWSPEDRSDLQCVECLSQDDTFSVYASETCCKLCDWV